MTTTPIIIGATLQPDGVTLQLDNKLALPPGRVTVTVQPTEPRGGRVCWRYWIASTANSSSVAESR